MPATFVAVDGVGEAMAHRRGGLFKPGYGFSVAHGQIVVPAKTYTAAMKTAVSEARRFNDVTMVVAKDKRRGGGHSVLATCIPGPRRVGKRVVVKCHVKIKPKKGRRR